MHLERYFEDPSVFRVNACPDRAYYIPHSSAEHALSLPRERSERVVMLSGIWRFNYYDSYYDLPDGFFLPDAALSGETAIPVPSVWQNHGFDRHQYTNVQYPIPFDPPYVPAQNPCGVYRRAFHWPGGDEQCFLNFEGVDSCFYVWLNGVFVGYSQVSHSSSEFDVSALVRPGENAIAVAVLKWCDGTYLEDQDKFRTSGIFRDVFLLRRPQAHIRDFFVRTTLSDDLSAAEIDVSLELSGPAAVRGSLIAPSGEVTRAEAQNGALRFSVPSPVLWTAETPALYTLTLEGEGEVIAQQVGIRRIAIKDGVVRLNDTALKFQGVNRHDSDPITGSAISPTQAMRDLELMKLHNVNAIRTSHYPNAPWFLELCNRLGFYVMLEADLETHGTVSRYGGYDLNDFSVIPNDPRFEAAIMDRVRRAVTRDKNQPAVLVWSLGNESGYGPSLEKAGRWVKEYDPDRLLHYEGAVNVQEDQPADTSMLDLYSRMYAPHAFADEYFAAEDTPKPYVLCEYSHAMGNSAGNFEEYQQMFRKYPGFCGGFIWEWCDHALYMGKTADGRPKYFYGGDFGEWPHDGNFCVDGLVSPDRQPHTSLMEYKNVIRPVRARILEDGVVEFTNLYDFVDLSDRVEIHWALSRNGEEVQSGVLPALFAAPHASVAVRVPYALPEDGLCCLNLIYRLKRELPLVPAGHVLGADQLILRDAPVVLPRPAAPNAPALDGTDTAFVVSGANFRYVFDRLTATFSELCVANRAMIDAPMRWNLWRAPIDNDRNFRLDWEKAGYDSALPRVYESDASIENGAAVLRARLSLGAKAVQKAMDIALICRVDGAGVIEFDVAVARDARLPDLPRFGVRLFLPKAISQVDYLGYGPYESYTDKHRGCLLGRYRTTAAEMHTDYLRPQENGSRFGCRFVAVTDGNGCGLRAESDVPFSLNASPYTQEELTEKRHNYELTPSGHTVLCLDYAQHGIGSNSCGPGPEEKYRFNATRFHFRFRLTPIG